MQKRFKVSVSTWNCLADCYASGISVAKSKHSDDILCWTARSERICRVLEDDAADIVCLQEVDNYEKTFKPCFTSLGYDVVYLKRPTRQDGVLVAFKRSKFELLKKDFVYFDDLANVTRTHLSISQRARLKKQNVAIILLLKTRTTLDSNPLGRKPCVFTVSTTHLYWNPISPLVKLAQAYYLLERIARVRDDSGLLPSASILTGDFNSLPQSQTYERVLSGIPVAIPNIRSPRSAAEKACEVFSAQSQKGNVVRFICDATLGRLARWLRLLGVDTALEDTESQEKRSTQNDFNGLFEKARSEHRIVVTTSTGMMKRAACPETFLIKATKSQGLEFSLAKLLNFYNVKLDRSNFLSICCKCGGRIETCDRADPRLEGKEAPKDRNLFVCTHCHQVYWRSSSLTGSCVRALSLAEKLFSVVQADRDRRFRYASKCISDGGGLDFAGEVFSDGSTEQETDGWLLRNKLSRGLSQNWLRYMSAFTLARGREPDYTNINGTFRGTLDYIFLGGACEVKDVIVCEGNVTRRTKKSFPNMEWPSDHMLVHADLYLTIPQSGRLSFERCLSLPVTRVSATANQPSVSSAIVMIERGA